MAADRYIPALKAADAETPISPFQEPAQAAAAPEPQACPPRLLLCTACILLQVADTHSDERLRMSVNSS